MKRLTQLLVMTSAVALLLGASPLAAQNNQDRGNRGNRGGRGGFDPAQMQERIMQGIKERLEITSDDDWKAIQPLVQNVMDARRENMALNVSGMRGFFGRGPGGPGGDRGGDRVGDRGRGGFFGEPNPDAEALQKAIDSKASASELKAALAKFREARKVSDAKLQKAQDDLRKVLTVRQEAILVSSGMLN